MSKPTITELDNLAHAGQLWSIEVLYEHKKKTCRMTYMNQTNDQVKVKLEKIFRSGFVIAVKDGDDVPVKGSYQVIPPLDIIEVYCHQQSGYFNGC